MTAEDERDLRSVMGAQRLLPARWFSREEIQIRRQIARRVAGAQKAVMDADQIVVEHCDGALLCALRVVETIKRDQPVGVVAEMRRLQRARISPPNAAMLFWTHLSAAI